MMNDDASTRGPGRAESRARVDAERILNAAFDGTLDAAGHLQFAELLRGDPKFRARWAHTARTLARLRGPTPGAWDRTDEIMARVHSARAFRAPPARRHLSASRLAWAAALALALVGIAVLARSPGLRAPAGAPRGTVASIEPPSHGAEMARPAPATTARPVTKAPVLAFDSKRYDRDFSLSINGRVDSPSGGPTTMLVYPIADGRVLLTDFEPYPHASTWREDLSTEPSWWVKAWTRSEPAWAGEPRAINPRR